MNNKVPVNEERESAEVKNLQHYLSLLGVGLDKYLEFDHPDAMSRFKEWHTQLDEALPEVGCGIEKVVQLLNDVVIPNGSPVPNPNFSAFITTGATTASILASAAANLASPQRYLGTAFNFIEELSLNWLAELCHLSHLKGVYSSGGSVANLVALGGARQWAFEQLGLDPAADGLSRPSVIYASEECHHTIQRSAGVLGLGRRSVEIIPCDRYGRMLVSELANKLNEHKNTGKCQVAIVANAGTTNRGMLDPLLEIGELAKEYNIWYHIDGAYGLPAVLDERLSEKFKGLELADSVIIDPHKWLGAAVGVAATFVKDREILLRAFTQEPADYLEGSAMEKSAETVPSAEAQIRHSLDDFGIPYFDYGVELSSPCRGIIVWTLLKEIGVKGMRARIIRHNNMARELQSLVESHPNLELMSPAELSICCFRYVSPEINDLNKFNQQLHRRLIRENQFMPSTTKVNGELAIRPCYVGARAEREQVKGLVDAVLKIATQLLKEWNDQ